MYDIGSKLRTVREKRGMTQRALAERISKSVSAISGYESNVQTPPTDVLISISQVLHVPITYFIDWDCKDHYSAKGLSQEQKELLDLLFEEFTTPSSIGNELSTRQIAIIQKVFLLFSNDKSAR